MSEHKRPNILNLGITRGTIFMIAGFLIGALLVSAIRLALGLEVFNWGPDANSFGFTQAAWVVGALFGAVAFMLGSGTVSDWLRWMRGQDTADHPHDAFDGGWARYLSASYDHKVIGIQYGVTSLIVLSIAGLFALTFRTELIAPGMQFLEYDTYNTIMSLHGIVMIYGMLLGVAAMSNYLVPLLIGARDMAFPRLNAFAYWLNVPAGIVLLSSLFLGGFDTGWTGYPPLSTRAPLGMDMFFLGVYLFGFSTIIGSLNIIVTTVKLRAPGMNYFRMPIFVWTALATSIISLTATQLIGLSFQLVLFERLFGMAFFNPAGGGDPILFQHLFWFYSHPAVYVFILTGLGVISELLPVFSRKPLYGYKWVALSSFGIALVGFLVWAHHMFTSGMAAYLRVPFMYSTLLVAVPTGVKFFSWVATIWEGKLSFETPMLFVLGGISIFLLGGLSGPPNGTVSTDLHLQDSYWIVGHFHATMFGGFIFPFFAAIYYWFPKMTGRMYNEKLGKLQFYLILPAFYVQSLGQMQVGLLGMRRRIADYDPALGIETSQLLITIAGFVIGLSLIVAFINIIYSAARGPVASSNPWRSRSPEWQIASPAPLHNYDEPFEVIGEPYDYGLAGSAFVSIDKERAPQVRPSEAENLPQSGAEPAAAD
ncbi:MAG TPA: cbb3-type cytochrome c oxidase subunit I [Anaerolineales bacterium]|nr:cbb3-type cytochrome c oxidase subunit I [Anaerolineales bacterium]